MDGYHGFCSIYYYGYPIQLMINDRILSRLFWHHSPMILVYSRLRRSDPPMWHTGKGVRDDHRDTTCARATPFNCGQRPHTIYGYCQGVPAQCYPSL